MEFDVSKVYTAVNADELKPGSKVIVSNCVAELKDLVANYANACTRILANICSESSLDGRFETVTGNIYQFAYLIEPPEEKKLKWTNLKPGDRIETKDKHGRRHEAIVTHIDCNSQCAYHVFTGYWISDEDLAEWEKVEQEVHND